jgi:branched-chain amino acid transport system permease protein
MTGSEKNRPERKASRLARPRLSRRTGGIILLLAGAIYPLIANDAITTTRFLTIALLGLAAIGLNLTLGVAGEFAIGHAGIFAAGAYCYGVLTATEGWSFFPALAVATFAAGVLGVVAAGPGLRIGGWAFAVASLLFAVSVPAVATVLSTYTGGEQGLAGIPGPSLFGHSLSNTESYVVVVICILLIMLALLRFEASSLGLAFASLRNSPVSAEANGIPTLRLKLGIYAVSSLIAGFAGAWYAAVTQFLSPASFSLSFSVELLAAVVIGGLGSLSGPLVGMVLLVYAPQLTASLNTYAGLFYGIILIAGMLLVPAGLVPTGSDLVRKAWLRLGAKRGGSLPSVESQDDSRRQDRERSNFDSMPPAPEPTNLTVTGLSKHFEGVQALDNVSLTAAPGRITAIIGSNGSGKSTLLNVLTGFYRPDSGSVQLNDRPITGIAPHAVARHGVSRTFQTPLLMPSVTILQNVMVGALSARRRSRLPKSAQQASVTELLRALNLETMLQDNADRATAGQQRLVDVALAIHRQRPVILFDEPAAGLVGTEVNTLIEIMRALRERGYTVVIVEHNVPLILALADLIVVLDAGAVIATGTASEISTNARVLDAYLGSGHVIA